MKEVLVGLETHVMVTTARKLFCDCTPGESSCSICEGLPGGIPLPPSAESLRKAALFARKLNSEVNSPLRFHRKHYSYFDLPTSFQRTQHPKSPFSVGGHLRLIKSGFKVPLTGVYLEEDPASVEKHEVNYNRSGNMLLEVVTSPCFRGTVERIRPLILEYLRTLSRLSVDLGLSSRSKIMKSDVNVSLVGGDFRYQIKNVTSHSDVISSVSQAIPLLQREVNSNKTFHFKLRLKFSRLKREYLFSEEYNVPPLEVPTDLASPPTFYQIYQKTHSKYPVPESLPYSKKLHSLSTTQKEFKLEDYLDVSPLEGLKRLKTRHSSELKPHLVECLNRRPISRSEYLQRGEVFRSFIRDLKTQLTLKGVKFNSLSINSVLEKILLK